MKNYKEAQATYDNLSDNYEDQETDNSVYDMNIAPVSKENQIKAICLMTETQLRIADRHLVIGLTSFFYAVCNAALSTDKRGK